MSKCAVTDLFFPSFPRLVHFLVFLHQSFLSFLGRNQRFLGPIQASSQLGLFAAVTYARGDSLVEIGQFVGGGNTINIGLPGVGKGEARLVSSIVEYPPANISPTLSPVQHLRTLFLQAFGRGSRQRRPGFRFSFRLFHLLGPHLCLPHGGCPPSLPVLRRIHGEPFELAVLYFKRRQSLAALRELSPNSLLEVVVLVYLQCTQIAGDMVRSRTSTITL